MEKDKNDSNGKKKNKKEEKTKIKNDVESLIRLEDLFDDIPPENPKVPTRIHKKSGKEDKINSPRSRSPKMRKNDLVNRLVDSPITPDKLDFNSYSDSPEEVKEKLKSPSLMNKSLFGKGNLPIKTEKKMSIQNKQFPFLDWSNHDKRNLKKMNPS